MTPFLVSQPSGAWAEILDGEAGAEAFTIGYAPGHVGGVVGEAELAVGGEEDDAAVAGESLKKIGDGLLRG